ncbi:MAG: hypothetical protein RXN93_08830 [Thermocladium sp.]
MQSNENKKNNENKKMRDVTVRLSPEAYTTARVLASMNDESVKRFLSEVLENWLRAKRREALTKLIEKLQTNNNNDNNNQTNVTVSDTDSGKSRE